MKAPVHPSLPSRKEFLALAKEHTLVPVCRTLTADLETCLLYTSGTGGQSARSRIYGVKKSRVALIGGEDDVLAAIGSAVRGPRSLCIGHVLSLIHI